MALVGKTNDEKIWNYLKSKGLNDYICASLMGNLYAESKLNPKNLQNTYEKKLGYTDETYTAVVDNGTYKNFIKDSAGYGIAQWTYHTRKKSLYEYAKSTNRSVGDLEMQLEFLYRELTEGYRSVFNMLKKCTSVLQASNVVLMKYEKPADQSKEVQKKRATYSQKFYDKYVKSNVVQNTPIIENIANSSTNVVNTEVQKMKYNANNKPLVCMQTTSRCYKNTRKMEVKGVLWHSTGTNNPYLKRYVQPSDNASDRAEMLKLLGKNQYNNDWNHTERSAGMNCFIGKLADGTVTTVQTMPWDYRPWGCGSGKMGSCNDGWIQFEICEGNLTDKSYFNKVYKEACEITAYLCKMYNLDPKGYTIMNGVKVPVILCHADSYKYGMGGNHADVLHWFRKHGKTMNDVRNDVADLMKKSGCVTSGVSNTDKTEGSATSTIFTPYRVKVTANILNIRKGAGTNYGISGTIRDKGVYTIVEEADGKGATKWLKLQSDIGWIASDYTKKIN